MLTIKIPTGEEFYDETNNRFFHKDFVSVEMEHSLAALSKWEEKYEKAFLGKAEKTEKELLYYFECMVISREFSPEVFSGLTQENLTKITEYINARMSATWFPETKETPSREVVTADLIDYWVISLGIPSEWRYQHLNKLFTLIRVFNLKNGKPKKESEADAIARMRDINARRRAELGTKG